MRPAGGSARADGRPPHGASRPLLDRFDLTIDEVVKRIVDAVRR